jgi:fatty acid omega-hydroxylase
MSTTVQNEVKSSSTMTPEQAFAEAMKFKNRPNPYPFFDELRKSPVARVTNGVYVITGYKEIIALAHDPRVSSDLRNSELAAAMRKAARQEGSGESEVNTGIADSYGREPSMIMSDPPDHDRMRRQAMRHFGPPHCPHLIPSMEADCERVVNGLLDKARGKTRIDAVDDYAYPLPVAVICRVLGVPLKDEPLFHGWIAEMMAGLDLGPEGATEEGKRLLAKSQASGAALREYLIALLESVKKTPNDGMISKMVHDDGPYGRMPSSEILSNCSLLLIAGHDSTVNLIAHCVLTLLRNPGSIDMLRRRPDLVPRAIEEVLRLESSVFFFPSRTALADIDIAGTTIPKGSPIFLIYGAGNRDPEQFTNPNKFDLERPEKDSLGWGSGIHTCFGGPLARLEVNVALETFLRRVKNPRLVVDPPPYRPNQVFRGPIHLQIDFDGIGD